MEEQLSEGEALLDMLGALDDLDSLFSIPTGLETLAAPVEISSNGTSTGSGSKENNATAPSEEEPAIAQQKRPRSGKQEKPLSQQKQLKALQQELASKQAALETLAAENKYLQARSRVLEMLVAVRQVQAQRLQDWLSGKPEVVEKMYFGMPLK